MSVILRLSQLGSLSNLLIVALQSDRLDLLAIGQLGDTLQYDAVAYMETRSYDIVLAVILWIYLDLRILHLVILGYDVNEDLILNLRASLLRDNDSTVMIVRNHDRTSTTTLQQLLWVSEVSDERDRTGSSIDDTTHLDYLTWVIIDRTVCQLQLNSWERSNGCLNTTIGLRHAQDLRLRE